MCTALTYKAKDFYFGRTLDFSHSFHEKIVVIPRNFSFSFKDKNTKDIKRHYAMYGMCSIIDNYPLFFDACNEKGLAIAALNFVGNAKYNIEIKNTENVATFELIPYILSRCKNVVEALELMKKVNITNIKFSENVDVSQLHWLLADSDKSVTIEAMKEGINIYDNPVGILTNNPPFNIQLFQLNNYFQLSPLPPKNSFLKDLPIKEYSYGLGAFGLPGDYSSQSRFIRAAFVKYNSLFSDNEKENISQFFHILETVNEPKGCVRINEQECMATLYNSCYNASKGIYYYSSYNNHQISAINLFHVNLEGNLMQEYKINKEEQIKYQN